MAATAPGNLYLHFPFCRRKCAYCALLSRAGASEAVRGSYAAQLARRVAAALVPLEPQRGGRSLATVYFGGGSPALCDLEPVFRALEPYIDGNTEFTVELHPLDVNREVLARLKAGGVNRVSMGLQSLDDAVLRAMGRGYTARQARDAFDLVANSFPNAGIDLIIGWPDDSSDYSTLKDWPLKHLSAYSLILEERTALAALVKRGAIALPGDDAVLDSLARLAELVESFGLERYEISNYARSGFECRHNLATWRGEDYIGLGEGAAGRLGLDRTMDGETVDTLTPEADLLERTLFRLRTRDGLDASRFPNWREKLDAFAAQGLLCGSFPLYRLTKRGTEVCDSILAELI